MFVAGGALLTSVRCGWRVVVDGVQSDRPRDRVFLTFRRFEVMFFFGSIVFFFV